MIEEDEYRGKQWDLGDDDYCDTCGSSWNMAEFDPDFNGPDEWQFSYHVGCYGGDSVSYRSDDREEKLDEMFKYLRQYPGWPRRLDIVIRDWIEQCDNTRELVSIPPQIFKVSNEEWNKLNKALNEPTPPHVSEGLRRLFGKHKGKDNLTRGEK